DRKGRFVKRSTSQESGFLEATNLLLELGKSALPRLRYLRARAECGRDALKCNPIQHWMFDRQPPEDFDGDVHRVTDCVVCLGEFADLGMEEFEGGLGECVDQTLFRTEGAVDRARSRVRRVRDRAYRQRRQSMLCDDAFGLGA